MTDIYHFLNKNNFSVSSEDKIIKNIEKDACAKHTIENSYEGFKYYGDKNKCMLFKSDKLNQCMNNYKDYKIKSFVKINDIIDINNIKDQVDSYKYFNEINNDYNLPDNLIKEFNVENEKECVDSCIMDYNDCKSVIYLDQPKSCSFYNKKKFKNKNEYKNKDNLFDIYTIKNINNYQSDNILSNISVNTASYKNETNNLISSSNIPLYNCSGLYSTNPFCTNEFDPDNINFKQNYINYTDCIDNNDYNKECKKKYGNEYIFDNDIYNLKSVIDCDNGGKRAKCKLDFSDIIENYENKYSNKELIISIFVLIILIIILVLYFFI